MNAIRKIVSQNKVRFVDTKTDANLDLAYITQRIIAMGFPSTGISSTYRNPQTAVAEFFDENHPGHYKIFNLAEEPYDQAKFSGPVEHWPFPDHHSPPIPFYLNIIKRAIEWLNADKLNVVAVHCIAGMGRTGTLICGILMFLGIAPDSDEALLHFALVRTGSKKGVSNPCQLRYVKYIEKVLRTNQEKGIDVYTPPEEPTRFLEKIVLTSIFAKSPKPIYITIQNNEWDVIYNSAWISEVTDLACQDVSFDVNMNIKGDFTINVYLIDKGLIAASSKQIMYFTISTAFINGDIIIANKSQIDNAYKDVKNEKFSPNLQLVLYFKKIGDHVNTQNLQY